MTFRIADVDTKTDFEDLVSCQWAAFENPFQGIVRLICPIPGTGPSARSEALKEGSDRQRDWYKGDPTSYWQKAVNDDGQIVGGALWKICENNPFAQSPSESTVVYWYPEGPEREFAAMALQRLDMPRKRMAQRPQIYLSIMFTHPSYRRQGVGGLLMKWGLEKAKELDLDIWLNASELGVPLYEKNGFIIQEKFETCPTTDNPSPGWTKIKDQLQLGPAWLMYRPAGRN